MSRYFAHALILVLVALTISGCATHGIRTSRMHHDGMATGFINKTIAVDGHKRNYVVYVPRDYTPAKSWPLIVFLHGKGERGDDGLLQTEVGIGRAIRRHTDWFPCIVAMPQCPDTVYWDKVFDHIDAVQEETRKQYNIDPDRIYLTGLSLGGFATWMHGAQQVNVYAALMPICGGGYAKDAAELAKVPIWAFHGGEDKTVPPIRSREMVEAVKKAGGDIKYTEFKGIDHNSWDPAYDDPETIAWLLKQRKKH